MNVTITTTAGQTLVVVEGRVDTTNSGEFEKQLAELFKQPQPDIVMDCSEFSYISSSGLRIFLTLQKYVNAHKGKFVVRNMQSAVKEVFDMTGFSNVFTII